jgi:hypothetical protein
MKRLITLLLILTVPMLSCAVLDGSGIANNIPKYYSDASIGVSSLTDNGTDLSVPAGYRIDGIDLSALSSGNVTGTGTTNTITKFTGAATIGNSNITDNGTHISTSKQIVSTLPNGNPPFQVTSGSWVGNLNVDQVDGIEGSVITDHNLRHQFLGDDQMSLNKLLMSTAGMWFWKMSDQAMALVTGSGTIFSSYRLDMVRTGSTNASQIGSYLTMTPYFGRAAGQKYTLGIKLQPWTVLDMSESYMGMFDNSAIGTFPTINTVRVGFRAVSTSNGVPAVLYASTANGTHNTEVLLDASWVQYDQLWAVVEYGYSGGVSYIKYWTSTDGVTYTYFTTINTNVPYNYTMSPAVYITNTEAVDKRVQIENFRILNTEAD